MSREFKFRVWLKPTYEHKCEFMDRYGKKLPDLDCRLYTQDDFFDDTWLDTEDYEDIIVEQYAGLKDKNGKEIYEGDIVYDIYTGDEVFIVGWDKDKASFMLADTAGYPMAYFDEYKPGKDLEVIGNIHENPELLGGEE